MKSLIGAACAMLIAAGALTAIGTPASADVVGAHVGPVGVGIGVGHHHHRHCYWRHHHQVCN
jgi:hypothetical protein